MALKARQLQLIEALMAQPMITDIEVGRQIGVSRNTIAEWKKNPEFQAELKERLRAKWEDSERIAMETMQKLAQNGDYKASKYILDSVGYAPTQRIEADITTDIEININGKDNA